MRIFCVSTRDAHHPQATGVEHLTTALRRRLAADGHEVVFFTSSHEEAAEHEVVGNLTTLRAGNRWSVIWHAWRYYHAEVAAGRPFDWIIEEVHHLPLLCRWYKGGRRLVIMHEILRDWWFRDRPLWHGLLGYLLERLRLAVGQEPVVTFSPQVRQYFEQHGLQHRVVYLPEQPTGNVVQEAKLLSKDRSFAPIMLYVGPLRPNKNVLDILKAHYFLLKKSHKKVMLWMVGDGQVAYTKKLRKYIHAHGLEDYVFIWNKVNEEEREVMFQQAYIFVTASYREYSALPFLEAASKGIPAVIYNLPELAEYVQEKPLIIAVPPKPEALAEKIKELLDHPEAYTQYQHRAWKYCQRSSLDELYHDFAQLLVE